MICGQWTPEACRGRESSVEEVIIEIRLAGVSSRGRTEDVFEVPWGSIVSNLNERSFASVEERLLKGGGSIGPTPTPTSTASTRTPRSAG